ncbi:hypothetical protein [Streptomyces erythrochromogenes]|uniref:hypothetical protein n=1 Tax=Streptomyces erythrochromogenes TaxID=285574 RepID=UPI0036FEA573
MVDVVGCDRTEPAPGCEDGHVHVSGVGRTGSWAVTIGFRRAPQALPHAAFLRLAPAGTAGTLDVLTESVINNTDWSRVLAAGYAQHLLGADAADRLDELWCPRLSEGSHDFSRLVAALHRSSVTARLPVRQVLGRVLQRGPDRVDGFIREARDRGLLERHDPRRSYLPYLPAATGEPSSRVVPPDAPPTWQMRASSTGAKLFDLPGCRDFDFRVGVCFCPSDQKGIPSSYLCSPGTDGQPGTSAYPRSLEIRPATWHAGGTYAELTQKTLAKLPLRLVLALGPEVQTGHLTTAMTMALAGNPPRRGPEHLQAVATVHRFALAHGFKPHDLVAQTWRVTLGTAQGWSRTARREGYLGERSKELEALGPQSWPTALAKRP